MSKPGVPRLGDAAADVAFMVVIPARFASTRLPGKPLRDIAGRSMIARVWDVASASGASEVLVATDDERIATEVEAIGGRALMSSPDHASGTDRLAELVERLDVADDTIVVNLQGDEPCMPPTLLRKLASELHRAGDGMATLATPITEAAEFFSESAVKVVCDDLGRAMYFSRAPIPWVRGGFAPQPEVLPSGPSFLRHLGIYAYRAGTLKRLAAAPQSELEVAESLEQLRALSLGIPIHLRVVETPPPAGVDTEADLQRATEFFLDDGGREN